MVIEVNLTEWAEEVAQELQQQALTSLENGSVLYFPNLPFKLHTNENKFLCATYADNKTKNISFDLKYNKLQGAICSELESDNLMRMMKRFATSSQQLINNLFPQYQEKFILGRTSFRPVEIAGRKAPSYRKDDTRLHVDAFPSTPMQGNRILRVFSNVNPDSKSRVWRLGAPFPDVVKHFQNKLTAPIRGSAFLLNTLKITKKKRTKYDHYMLQLHNLMKADLIYQHQVEQQVQHFMPGSTWIVYTDQVSHAAMSGQFTFEQTFYVPQEALLLSEKSPCKILENFLQQPLL